MSMASSIYITLAFWIETTVLKEATAQTFSYSLINNLAYFQYPQTISGSKLKLFENLSQ